MYAAGHATSHRLNACRLAIESFTSAIILKDYHSQALGFWKESRYQERNMETLMLLYGPS